MNKRNLRACYNSVKEYTMKHSLRNLCAFGLICLLIGIPSKIRTQTSVGFNISNGKNTKPNSINTSPTPIRFHSTPVTGAWSNQLSITVSWSGTTADFSNATAYRYIFDQNLETSTTQSSYLLTSSTTVISSVLNTGIYYFHVWAVSNTGIISPMVHTVGPFYIDSYAPNTPILKNIPDIKLLKDTSSTTLLYLPDYSSNTSVPWSWSIESSWRHHTNMDTQIIQSGNWITYSPDTNSLNVGRERIKFTADSIFNNRSILKLSSFLWNQKFPDFIFKDGQPFSNSTISLVSYMTSANNAGVPLFDAKGIDSKYVTTTVDGSNLILNASTTIGYPVRIKVKAFGSNPTTDWDGQYAWVRENWLGNGDFQSNINNYWAFQNVGITQSTASWLGNLDGQNGVLQLMQWSNSTVKLIQNVTNNPGAPSPFLPIHGGTWYTLRVKLKTDVPTSARSLTLQMHGYSGYGASTTLSAVELVSVPITTTWQNYELSFYSRANVSAILLVSNLFDAPTSSIYVDDFQLIEKDPDVISAYGKTVISINNGDFQNDLSGWAFQGNGRTLQSQDTSWQASYNGRNGVCVLNLSNTLRTKFTQWVSPSDTSSRSVRFHLWAATDATDNTLSPTLIMVFNTFNAQTTQILDVMGYGTFNVAAGGKWARYDFSCPAGAPLIAVQVQGWGNSSSKLYIKDIQIDRENDSPYYWDNEEINESELIQIDTTNPMFFRTVDSGEQFIPLGTNFHDYYLPWGFQDEWWNPYSEDSFSPLYLDTNFEQLESIGGNVIKVTPLIHDFLADFDREYTPVDTTGQYFPTYQSVTNVQIPPRFLDRLDQIVDLARRHHLRVILTMPFNYQQMNWWLAGGGNYGDTTKRILSQFWNKIANRYDANPTIMSYSFLVEQWLQMREWGDTTFAYNRAQTDKYFTSPVSDQWHQWLMSRYTTIGNLNSTWGNIPIGYRLYATGLPYANFNSIPVPGFDGKSTPGSSLFTNGTGGGGNTTYHIPDGPTRLDSGTSTTLQWTFNGNTTYLSLVYLWRKEKSNLDPNSFGTTWNFLSSQYGLPLSYTDPNTSTLSTYRYEVTGGSREAWRNYPEGTDQNENATFDPMLSDFILFRESAVDAYNYNQTSTIMQVETGGDPLKPRHLTSIGLSQFNYFLRYPAILAEWGGPPSLTAEGPYATMGYNVRELVKSLDFNEMSFYPGFPPTPLTADNPNPGFPQINSFGEIEYTNEMINLQYMRMLLRFGHTNANSSLAKPILLKEFASAGSSLTTQNQWNNLILDYTQRETGGFLTWFFTDNTFGLFNTGHGITPWGQSFARRADDLKYTEYSYPSSTRVLQVSGGISTTSNLSFMLTATQYRDINVSNIYDPGGNFFTLGRFMNNCANGVYLPNEYIDLNYPDNSNILPKSGF